MRVLQIIFPLFSIHGLQQARQILSLTRQKHHHFVRSIAVRKHHGLIVFVLSSKESLFLMHHLHRQLLAVRLRKRFLLRTLLIKLPIPNAFEIQRIE